MNDSTLIQERTQRFPDPHVTRNKPPTPLKRSAPAWLPLLNEFVACLAVPITAPGFDAADRRASEIITTAEAGPGEFEDALLAALRDKQARIAARGRTDLAALQRKAGAK